jgi:hypothetical protein
MPLAAIGKLLALDGPEAAQALTGRWDGVEAVPVERRDLLTYLQARLRGEEPTVYDIKVRSLPERSLISINHHVNALETEAFFDRGRSRRGLHPSRTE